MTNYKVLIGFVLSLVTSLHLVFAQKNADTVLQHSATIKVEALRQLNSPYRETNLCITPDGNFLLFMSSRGGQIWSNPYYTTYKGKPQADGDIWVSKKENGKFMPPFCAAGISTRLAEDEPNVSPDMSKLYFQSWKHDWDKKGGPYFVVNIENGKMSKPKGFYGGVALFFQQLPKNKGVLATDGATVSADGKVFIFASGDYQGNMDLYISRLDENGWSYPEKLKEISDHKNQRAPFLAADGKTLYFASDAYKNGFGGLDIYKTTLNDDNSTGEVINIGKPFNTRRDDYGFVITQDGSEAYMVRDGDIYFVDLKDKASGVKPEAQ